MNIASKERVHIWPGYAVAIFEMLSQVEQGPVKDKKKIMEMYSLDPSHNWSAPLVITSQI